jgi:uncharacterized protein (TIGR03083 family)
MKPGAHLAEIHSRSRRLLRLCAAAVDRPVQACPGWTLTELLHHLGTVYANVNVLIKERPIAGATVWRRAGPTPPPGSALVDWFRSATESMIATFRAADPDDPAWSWSPNQTVGFWIRRMCHEVAVHHWDAAQARGYPLSLPAGLADDGLDEFLTEFVPLMRRRQQHVSATGEYYEFVAFDTGRRWTVLLDGDTTQVTRTGAEKGAATTLRATAEELLLLLWRRLPASTAEVSNPGGLDRWFELVGCP